MRLFRLVLLVFVSVVCLSPLHLQSVKAAGCDTTSDIMRVNVKTGGGQARFLDWGYDLSDDARYVVYESMDNTIVPNDTNGDVDTFLHDRQTCTTILISRNPSGDPGSGATGNTAEVRISGNGRYILFESEHTDLVPGDNAGFRDVFLYDHLTQTITRVSNGMAGANANNMSLVSDISADGQYVLFMSLANNIVPDDTNDNYDTFLYHTATGNVERVSVNSSGEEGDERSWYGEVSDDGRYIAFITNATNMSPLDTSLRQKAVLRDRLNSTTTLVSVNSAGEPADNETYYVFLSSLGNYVGFMSDGENLDPADTNGGTDGFVRDLAAGTTEWVTPRVAISDFAYAWGISADGRYVATELFDPATSVDTNGAGDVYLYDRLTHHMILESRTPAGNAGNSFSYYPFLTADVQYAIFGSNASDLNNVDPPGDTRIDIFVARLRFEETTLEAQTNLQGRPPAPDEDWETSVRVVLKPIGGTTPVFDDTLTTDNSGRLNLGEFASGTYTLWVKGSNTLATSQSITITGATASANTGILRAGDANGDNVVNLVDFSLLAASFGKQSGNAGYDARADFNGDDQVTLPDFSLLATNFNTSGAPLPG